MGYICLDKLYNMMYVYQILTNTKICLITTNFLDSLSLNLYFSGHELWYEGNFSWLKFTLMHDLCMTEFVECWEYHWGCHVLFSYRFFFFLNTKHKFHIDFRTFCIYFSDVHTCNNFTSYSKNFLIWLA